MGKKELLIKIPLSNHVILLDKYNKVCWYTERIKKLKGALAKHCKRRGTLKSGQTLDVEDKMAHRVIYLEAVETIDGDLQCKLNKLRQ